MTGQYYLRARYYNPVNARFTQEDTYYSDGLNLYTYCRNNPILNHDPTGHGTKENSPYSRKEQQYIDAGADPDTAKLETQCYPDAKSKQDLYNKYKSQGYNATDAKKLANYEIVHGEERAKNYAANNVKKSGPDYTPTSPRDNVNTDWRTQNRLNAQKKAGAGKSGSNPKNVFPENPDDLLPEIPRNKATKANGTTSQTIQTSDNIRIRAEQHPLLPGETYNPRHHGVHYHVEYKVDPTKSWNNKNNVKKWYPEGYTPGAGSGFIPGEPFPE